MMMLMMNEALQRCRIYPLSYETMQRFVEALSNLTRPLVMRMLPGLHLVVDDCDDNYEYNDYDADADDDDNCLCTSRNTSSSSSSSSSISIYRAPITNKT